ncbi:MAG TPA: anaerobic ribonucleoside-triphosphate reductase activating protein [Coprothermobacter sp.]|nr:anaerobic ribonucleoside-triphosphate reductase activating protein [Coprothermobacter sp.]
MIIGGLQKFSLIDYPGKISAIVFTRGCNFRCPYCHNPELVDPQRYAEPWQEEEFWAFLQSRTQKLDAVVVTGGEPTLQEGLQPFLERIRKMGFLIKLDTNGSNPDVLKDLLSANLVDYIAMDIKAPLEKYSEVAKVSIDKTDIEESIELIKQSNVDHEFRTTIAKNVLSKEDVVNIAKMLQGEKLYILQRCIPTKILDPLFLAQFEPYTHEELEQIANLTENYVLQCLVR